MRLTLRTMLAYLDDILEPADQAEIGKKIQESEFATELVHRTRDVVRRLRLGAPQVVGRGVGLDANSVAEYLDNTIPPEKVTEFEKVCLESDAHLAETAACHQVLTLVLGQPADVSRVSRERMYQIPDLAAQVKSVRDSAQAIGRSVGAPPAAERKTAAPAPAATPRSQVPDYLRESSRSRLRSQLLVAFFALVVLGAIAMVVLQPNILGRGNNTPSGNGNVESGAPEVAPAAPVPNTNHVAPPTTNVAPPAAIEPAPAAPVREPTELVASVPDDEPVAPPLDLPPGAIAAVVPTPDAAPPDRPNEPPAAAGAADLASVAETTEAPAIPAAANAAQVGVYVPDKNVLLRYEEEQGGWTRLPPRAAIRAGDRLLALPTFRPTVTLSNGITLQLAGGTAATLMGTAPDGSLGIEIHYGRVIAIGQAGGPFRLRMNDLERTVEFADPNSTLALDVHRTLPPGVDPQVTRAPLEGEAFVASGKIVWHATAERSKIASPAQWSLPEGVPGPAIQANQLPTWINSEELDLTDKLASQALDDALKLDRPIGLSLSELVSGRKSEVRSLAVRCSVHVGDFEPFVAALADLEQRGMWATHIETLRGALALGPEIAGQVHAALLQKRGSGDGEELYRLLWSYNDAQLKGGDAEKLVGYLQHEKKEFRVLASWNLKAITGMGPDYRPEYSPARHQRSVDRWRERLQAGEIHWKTAETPASP